MDLWLPGAGRGSFDERGRLVKMNGREVFKFATRILVVGGGRCSSECGLSIDDVDVYVPTRRTSGSSTTQPGSSAFPSERVVINVDRYGNTSSGSIPLALADAPPTGG